MNYQTLMGLASELSAALGYHPAHAENLHSTLRHEGFPIALVGTPRLLSVEGEKEVERVHAIEIKLLNSRGYTPEERTAKLSLLMADAERFAGRLAECQGVREVTIEEVAPEERTLTVAGESAVALKVRVKSFECNA